MWKATWRANSDIVVSEWIGIDAEAGRGRRSRKFKVDGRRDQFRLG